MLRVSAKTFNPFFVFEQDLLIDLAPQESAFAALLADTLPDFRRAADDPLPLSFTSETAHMAHFEDRARTDRDRSDPRFDCRAVTITITTIVLSFALMYVVTSATMIALRPAKTFVSPTPRFSP